MNEQLDGKFYSREIAKLFATTIRSDGREGGHLHQGAPGCDGQGKRQVRPIPNGWRALIANVDGRQSDWRLVKGGIPLPT